MISYRHLNQEYALKVRDALKAANIPYWIDVERIRGSIEEAMDEAVRNAAVVLVCFSQQYKDSAQCQSEALIARQLKQIIVPVRVQSGYEYDGWLRTVLIGLLFYDITQPTSTAMENLVKQLQKIFLQLVVPNAAPSINSQPQASDALSHAESQQPRLATLTRSQVHQLLEKNNFNNLIDWYTIHLYLLYTLKS